MARGSGSHTTNDGRDVHRAEYYTHYTVLQNNNKKKITEIVLKNSCAVYVVILYSTQYNTV